MDLKLKSRRVIVVFTQPDTGALVKALLLQDCHKTVQGGRVCIHQLPLVLERWRKNQQGRGVDSQCLQGSTGQVDKDDFQTNFPEKSKKKF